MKYLVLALTLGFTQLSFAAEITGVKATQIKILVAREINDYVRVCTTTPYYKTASETNLTAIIQSGTTKVTVSDDRSQPVITFTADSRDKNGGFLDLIKVTTTPDLKSVSSYQYTTTLFYAAEVNDGTLIDPILRSVMKTRVDMTRNCKR